MPDPFGRSLVACPPRTVLHSVGIQDNKIICWGTVTMPDQPDQERLLIMANTGATVNLRHNSRFLGTITSDNGIVWHIWEL